MFSKPTDGPDPQDEVRFHLHRLLCHEEDTRYAPDFIHASTITAEDSPFCPREWALYDRTGRRPYSQQVTAAQQVTYSMGHLLQERVTHWMTLAGLAIGNWRCDSCGHEAKMCRQRTCCNLPMRYEEMRFQSAQSGVSCGVDLLVQLPTRRKLVLIEVKTEQKEEFKRLVMPRAEHRTRTALYLRIIAESTDPATRQIDTGEARVLYFCKGGWGEKGAVPHRWGLQDGPWSPFKEYVVRETDADTDVYQAPARELHLYRTAGGPMPQAICPTQFCRRAKYCPVVSECFSGAWG
jgi:hypothetical protein